MSRAVLVAIGDVADYVAAEKCGREKLAGDDPVYSRAYRAARDPLMDAVKSGEIEATKEQPAPMLTYLSVGGMASRPRAVGAPEYSERSRVAAYGAARVLMAARLKVPEALLALLPPDERNKFDPLTEMRELSSRCRQKSEAFSGLLIGALTEGRANLRKGDGINADALAEKLLSKVTDGEGRALNGWSKTTLKNLIGKGVAAFKVSIET